MLESLVSENESFKQDNAELQTLLTATREDLRALQEELEERRATEPQYSEEYDNDVVRPHIFQSLASPISPTFNFGTAPAPSALQSAFVLSEAGPSAKKRSISAERGFRRNAVGHSLLAEVTL